MVESTRRGVYYDVRNTGLELQEVPGTGLQRAKAAELRRVHCQSRRAAAAPAPQRPGGSQSH